MGYMKELAIQQQEQQLIELHEQYHIESLILHAEANQRAEDLMHQELLLDEQIKQDIYENKN